MLKCSQLRHRPVNQSKMSGISYSGWIAVSPPFTLARGSYAGSLRTRRETVLTCDILQEGLYQSIISCILVQLLEVAFCNASRNRILETDARATFEEQIPFRGSSFSSRLQAPWAATPQRSGPRTEPSVPLRTANRIDFLPTSLKTLRLVSQPCRLRPHPCLSLFCLR